MSDNINFKDLWNKQISIAPNPDNLIFEIKKLKKSNLKKLVLTNLLFIATSVSIILIWMYFQPQLLSTKIGILLIILSKINLTKYTIASALG